MSPPALAVGAGVAAVTVAVAAAIAIYENEDVRRYADQIRRRLAIALHNLGNELDPGQTHDLEPLFNRPEDAEGFLMSSRGGLEPGVDADDESKKRQREELMYWNALRESQMSEKPQPSGEKPRSRAVSFDDFLKPDASGEDGTLVCHHRRPRPGCSPPLFLAAITTGIATGVATGVAGAAAVGIASGTLVDPEASALIDFGSESSASTISGTLEHSEERPRSPVLNEAANDAVDPRFGDRASLLFDDISAWAQATDPANRPSSPMSSSGSFSHAGFSDGQLTPTTLYPVHQNFSDAASQQFEVRSVSEGMFTPASWSEVGSTISEDDIPVPVHQ
ncbi:unnamed protein product [Parascedosporium putredinis]|uniref:Uncharacterized protein n=1 Tax=Parascedosporium putredinis TaxID=1442378 RepID=A0A9P1H6L2_9PEZI|nr:unnamed protein product [Parascedosporium putredinis]CAI7998801.1 unnamed protein product [Parascedosporium putredinis]